MCFVALGPPQTRAYITYRLVVSSITWGSQAQPLLVVQNQAYFTKLPRRNRIEEILCAIIFIDTNLKSES